MYSKNEKAMGCKVAISKEEAERLGGATASFLGDKELGCILCDEEKNLFVAKICRNSKQWGDPENWKNLCDFEPVDSKDACFAWKIDYGNNLSIEKEVEYLKNNVEHLHFDDRLIGCGSKEDFLSLSEEGKKDVAKKILEKKDRGVRMMLNSMLPPTKAYIPFDVASSGSMSSVFDYIENNFGVRPEKVSLTGEWENTLSKETNEPEI